MLIGKIKDIPPVILLKFFSLFPINNRKIIFKSNRGSKYNCNPRAIYEEMKAQNLDLIYIWVMKDKRYNIPGAKVVKNGSIRELYHLATSKIWIDNKRKGLWIRKRKGQYYVQTWHGHIPMKKIEKEAIENGSLDELYLRVAQHDSAIADLFIAGSEWQEKHYMKAFWYNGKILKTGLPRSDILYKDPDRYKEKVCSYFNLRMNSNLLLYAPTFRVDGNTNCYNIDYNKLINALETRFGGKWKIIVRLHPNIADKQGFMDYNDSVLNGSKYDEINELIMACDFLISDYSSCMFDAIEANKKVMIYASDYVEYQRDRGMYFSFEEMPFSVAKNNRELEECIIEFDEKRYFRKIDSFKKFFNIYNNGNSSREAVKYILNDSGVKINKNN